MKEKITKSLNKIKLSLKKSFSFINQKNKFNTMEVIALMIITLIFGMVAGGVLMYRKGTLNIGIKKELNEFVETYTEILNDYYKEVSEDGLLEAGINGMVNFLGDPYSTFMNQETSVAFNEKVSGEYVGIGTEIAQYSDSKIEFVNVYKDGPAFKAGLRDGDLLVKVDDKNIKEKTLTEISSLVKGKEGTKVKLTILRDDLEKEFTVERTSIDIKSVTSEVITYNNQKVGYLVIDIFAANTYQQFKEQLENLEKEKINSLIIDVRNNSGGYLTTVTDILSLFMEKGDLIYQLKTKDDIEKIYDKTKESRDYDIAVLVNGASASASELLASALKDSHSAYIVGTTTYGKSKVQKTYELSNGTSIKYTFQEWLTPNGESIGDVGLTPEYEVTYQLATDDNQYDSQMQKALDLLTDGEK